jgi:hypothetical protein
MTTFKPYTYWTAWPENHVRAEDFPTRREAAAFVRRNGGGAIRKFRQVSEHCCSTRMDAVEIGPRAASRRRRDS